MSTSKRLKRQTVLMPRGSLVSLMPPDEYEWRYVMGRLHDLSDRATYRTYQRYWSQCATPYNIAECDRCPLVSEGCPLRGQWWINIVSGLSYLPPYGMALPLMREGRLSVYDPSTGNAYDGTHSLIRMEPGAVSVSEQEENGELLQRPSTEAVERPAVTRQGEAALSGGDQPLVHRGPRRHPRSQ